MAHWKESTSIVHWAFFLLSYPPPGCREVQSLVGNYQIPFWTVRGRQMIFFNEGKTGGRLVSQDHGKLPNVPKQSENNERLEVAKASLCSRKQQLPSSNCFNEVDLEKEQESYRRHTRTGGSFALTNLWIGRRKIQEHLKCWVLYAQLLAWP